MAPDSDSPSSITLSTSPQTALCYLPPVELVNVIQQFRSVYDQAAIKWPPHINVLYPFVPQDSMQPAAVNLVSQHAQDHFTLKVKFTSAEAWRFKSYVTIVLIPDIDSTYAMEDLDEELSHGFPPNGKGKSIGDGTFRPHLTIGQAPRGDEDRIESLRRKAEMLCEVLGTSEWSLAAMTRVDGNMKLVKNWGSEYDGSISLLPDAVEGSVVPRPTYTYNSSDFVWEKSEGEISKEQFNSNITVATYNVMYESDRDVSPGRFLRVIGKILEAKADVVVLQEVSDDFLAFALGNLDMARRYPYATHCPGVPLVRMHNCVLLSSQQFSWEELVVDKTKSAVVAKFGDHHRRQDDEEKEEEGKDEGKKGLVVVGVHLPAHLTEASVAKKNSYFSVVDGYLSKHHAETPCIVAGDFNIHSEETVTKAVEELGVITKKEVQTLREIFPSSSYIDAWQASGDDVSGSTATFDPFTNDLAQETVRKYSKLPPAKHNFDKILLRIEGSENVNIREARIFGKPLVDGLPRASDHYGLSANVQFKQPSQRLSEEPLELLEANISAEAVLDVVLEEGLIPSIEDTILRDRAVTALKRCLHGSSPNSLSDEPPSSKEETFKMELRIVGSTAMGTYDAESDIDCLVVGNITSKVFWKVARQRIRRWGGADGDRYMGIKVVRYVDAAVPMLVLLVGSRIRVDLQYCTAVRLVEAWHTNPNIPSNDPLFNLPLMTLKKLRPVRDMDHILSVLPHLPNFRLAYRFIKLWAQRRGVYSSKFGYLGGIHITLLLARVCILLPGDATVPQLLRVFFNQYANWDWKNKEVVLPILPKKVHYTRGAREPMVILTVTSPVTNAAFNSSRHTLDAIRKEMQLADQKLAAGSSIADWSGFFGDNWHNSTQAGAAEFLAGYPTYIKVELQFWGQIKSKGRAMVGFVESRCVMLLVLLAEKFPGLSARIWPKRFKEISSEDGQEDDDSEELRGFYLIGLTPSELLSSKEEKKAAESKITDAVRTFENTMKGHIDESTTFLQVSCIKRSEIIPKDHTVKIDDSGTWDGNVGEEESIDSFVSSSDEEDDDDDIDDADAETARAAAASLSSLTLNGSSSSSSGTRRKHENSGPTPKLRTSADIYHRLMWDDKYDSADYLIGYEDRFKGVMEMDVVSWKTEMSDEEFVPMHRVVYFKRKSDGVVIWDRVWKKDLVFNSGVVS